MSPRLSSLPSPGPTSPLPRAALPAAGNHQHGHTLTRPSPGFQGSPSHPAVGRAPGFSPAPSSPLEGLPLRSPSPSGRASRAPCALRAPLQLFLCRRGRPESRALHAPLQPLLPHEDSCSPARLSVAQLEHPRLTDPGDVLGASGPASSGSHAGARGAEVQGWDGVSGKSPAPLPGWLTTAGMGLSPRGLSPRCQERRNKAARRLSAQSEIESGGEGGFSSLVSGNPMP